MLCGYGSNSTGSYRALLEDVFDGNNGGIDFFVFCVEVRREAHAGLRAVVDEYVALQKFAADFVRVGHIDRNGAAALLRVAGRIHSPASLVGEFDEPGGLAL